MPWGRQMRRMLRTAAIIALTLAVLAALLWLGDVHRGLTLVRHIRIIYLAWFGVSLLCYEICRYVLWLLLLDILQTGSDRRAQLFAFAVGEAVKFVPTGAYVQNAILARTQGVGLARSSAATTLIIFAEIAVALAIVLVLGVNGWGAWTRVAVLAFVVAAVLVMRRSRGAERTPEQHHQRFHGRLLSRLAVQVRHLQDATGILLRPRPVLQTVALTVLYEIFGGLGLYVVVRSLNIGSVTAWQAIAVNCFGLAFYVVLGSLEVAAAGAFVAMGVDRSAAITAVLVNRTLGVLGTFVLSALILAFCRDQWPMLLQRPRRQGGEGSADGMPSTPLPVTDA